MLKQRLTRDSHAADQIIVYAMVGLVCISFLSIGAYIVMLSDDEASSADDGESAWVDPVVEIEDEQHSHTDLLAHRLQTDNMQLIDYHNLNCDGNVAPPAELDNVAGRPCYPEYKNVGPTPGDSSEISIEGNFMEDCVKNPDGTGGCYAYVSSYNQFEILDISKPNNITLLLAYRHPPRPSSILLSHHETTQLLELIAHSL